MSYDDMSYSDNSKSLLYLSYNLANVLLYITGYRCYSFLNEHYRPKNIENIKSPDDKYLTIVFNV